MRKLSEWQVAVLNSENIRIDQYPDTDYRMEISVTDKAHRMSPIHIIGMLAHANKDPVIWNPDKPNECSPGDLEQITRCLIDREDAQEYWVWEAEARMNSS